MQDPDRAGAGAGPPLGRVHQRGDLGGGRAPGPGGRHRQGLLHEDRGVPHGVKQGQRLHRPPAPVPRDQPGSETSSRDFPEIHSSQESHKQKESIQPGEINDFFMLHAIYLNSCLKGWVRCHQHYRDSSGPGPWHRPRQVHEERPGWGGRPVRVWRHLLPHVHRQRGKETWSSRLH